MYIENINGPADVKKLNIAQMTVLASEMRDALLTKLSRHGGHFGPNFGMHGRGNHRTALCIRVPEG